MITLKIVCDRCKTNKLEVEGNNLNLVIRLMKLETNDWKVGIENDVTYQVCSTCVDNHLKKKKKKK